MKRTVVIFVLLISIIACAINGLADQTVYETPSATDAQAEEAISIARNVLIENYEDGVEQVPNSNVETQFGYIYMGNDLKEPVWGITLRDPENYAGEYYVVLSRDGKVLMHSAPYAFPYGPDDDELSDVTFSQPGPHDISEQEAIEIALSSIHEISDFETRMDKLTTKAYFLYGERFNRGFEPVWLIHFFQDDILQQKMLLGYDGSYIQTVAADKKITRVFRNAEGFERWTYRFWDMTVEEKAAFSQKWNPVMEAYIKENPYYPNQNSDFYQATRHVFGVPGENHISIEAATIAGKDALLEMGADRSKLDQRDIGYSFEITDPEKPIWVLVFHAVMNDDGSLASSSDGDRTCAVKIDANTGEVIKTYVYHDENSFDGYYR